MYFGNKMFYCS